MAIVCHCEVVRERTIVKAISRGATALDEVRAACGATAGCGGCEAAVLELLERHSHASFAGPSGASAMAGARA